MLYILYVLGLALLCVLLVLSYFAWDKWYNKHGMRRLNARLNNLPAIQERNG